MQTLETLIFPEAANPKNLDWLKEQLRNHVAEYNNPDDAVVEREAQQLGNSKVFQQLLLSDDVQAFLKYRKKIRLAFFHFLYAAAKAGLASKRSANFAKNVAYMSYVADGSNNNSKLEVAVKDLIEYVKHPITLYVPFMKYAGDVDEGLTFYDNGLDWELPFKELTENSVMGWPQNGIRVAAPLPPFLKGNAGVSHNNYVGVSINGTDYIIDYSSGTLADVAEDTKSNNRVDVATLIEQLPELAITLFREKMRGESVQFSPKTIREHNVTLQSIIFAA